MEKTNALKSIHTSPAVNLNANNVFMLPFDISSTTPEMQNNKPVKRNGVMVSFKKMAEIIMAKMGEAVVPIKARLIADVVWPAT